MCLLVQLPLIWTKMEGAEVIRLIGLLIFLPLGIPLLLRKIRFPGWLQMGVAAGTVGSLAMLLGAKLHQSGNGQMLDCCAIPSPPASVGTEAWLNWSSGLMLLACLGSCLLLCPIDQSGWRQPTVWLKHLGCSGGMWLGMIFGGHLLSGVYGDAFGRASGMHLAMVIGMIVGAAASHWLFWQSREQFGAFHRRCSSLNVETKDNLSPRLTHMQPFD